jgi:hypothetical protein
MWKQRQETRGRQSRRGVAGRMVCVLGPGGDFRQEVHAAEHDRGRTVADCVDGVAVEVRSITDSEFRAVRGDLLERGALLGRAAERRICVRGRDSRRGRCDCNLWASGGAGCRGAAARERSVGRGATGVAAGAGRFSQCFLDAGVV